MKTTPIQLAYLYRNGRFFGYGLAVDGVLLECLQSTTIDTIPGELPRINAVFNLSNEIVESPIKIDISIEQTGR